MEFQSVETRDMSGLTVHKDSTIPILAIGGVIFMLGVVIGSYWNHRRVWVEQLEDGTIRLAAHTNKNWFSIKKDLNALSDFAHLPPYIDRGEEDKDGEGEGKEKEGDSTL